MERVRERHRAGERQNRDDEAAAELAEMLDELRGLILSEPPWRRKRATLRGLLLLGHGDAGD